MVIIIYGEQTCLFNIVFLLHNELVRVIIWVKRFVFFIVSSLTHVIVNMMVTRSLYDR